MASRVGTATFPISADAHATTGMAVKSAEDEVNRIVTDINGAIADINNAGYVTASTPAFTAPVTSTGGATFHSGAALPAGGSTSFGIKLSSTNNFGIFGGSGAPTIIAAPGSLYIRSDGTGTGDRFYISKGGGSWAAGTTDT
jgi:hypothetical protein